MQRALIPPFYIFLCHGDEEPRPDLEQALQVIWRTSQILVVSDLEQILVVSDLAQLNHHRDILSNSLFVLCGEWAAPHYIRHIKQIASSGLIFVCADNNQDSAAVAVACLQAGADEYQVIANEPAEKICERVQATWRSSYVSYRVNRPSYYEGGAHSDQLQSLHDLFLSLTGVLSIEELVDQVYAYINLWVAPETFVAAVYDDVEQNYLTFFRSESVSLLDEQSPYLRIDPINSPEDSGAIGWMIRQRQPIHVRDIHLQNDIPIIQITENLPRTWVGLPLIIYDQVVGALSIHSVLPNAFTDDQVRLFYALANQIGLALQGARLYKNETVRHQFTEILHRLSTDLINSRQQQQIFELAGEATRQIFPKANSVSITLLSDDHEYFSLVYDWREPFSTRYDDIPTQMPAKNSYFLQRLLKKVETVVVEDVQTLEFDRVRFESFNSLIEQELRAVVMVPLVSNERLIGAFYIDFWEQPRRFSPVQIQTVESVASRTAVGLENVRLRHVEERRREHAEILHDISSRFIRIESRTEIFSSVERAIRTVFPRVADISFFLLDLTKEFFDLLYIWVKDDALDVVPGRRFPKRELVQNYEVLLSGNTLTIQNIADFIARDSSLYSNLQILLDSGLHSAITLPLVVQGQGIGTLWLGFWDHEEHFSPEQIQLLESIAGHTAVALDSFRIYDIELTRRQYAEALHRLSGQLIRTADQQQIFSHVVEALLTVFPLMQDCSFSFIDETREYIVRTNAWTSSDRFAKCYTGNRFVIKELALAQDVLTNLKTVAIPDLREMDSLPDRLEALAQQLWDTGLRACVTLPLVVNRTAIGSVWIGFWDEPNYCTPEQIQFVESVASHAATAIENTRLQSLESYQRQQSEVLHRLSSNLMHASDSGWIFQQTVMAVRAIFPEADDISFSILDKGKKYLVREEVWFSRPELDLLGDRPRFLISDLKLSHRALNDVQTVVVEDIHELTLTYEQEDSPSRTIAEGGMRSVIYLPLLVKGEVMGLMGVVFWDEPRRFSTYEIQTIEAIAGHVAVAMENVRLYDELHQHVYERSVLNDVAMSNNTAANLDQMLEFTTKIIAGALDFQSFGFYILDEQQQMLNPHSSYYFSVVDAVALAVPLQGSFIGSCVQLRDAVMTGDLQREEYFTLNWPDVHSVIAVPLIVDGKTVAVINVESDAVDAFDQEVWSFLTVLAGQMTSAWQRVRLYEQIQQHADNLSKQVEIRTAQLQAERDRLEIILSSAGEGIFFTDTQGTIAYANPALVAQSGYRLDYLIGRPASILGSEGTKQGVFDELWSKILGGERWRGELVNQHRDGRLYTVNMTITPIMGLGTDIEGFVAVQSDITYFKELDRLKSEFVSNVSHELRTPLTNISMYLRLMERGRVEKRDHYLMILHQETDRLTTLIQDLLSLSQLEAGMEPDFEWIDLGVLVRSCIEGFSARVQTKRILVEMFADDDLPEIFGDAGQINQVLVNILGNAISYTPDNGRIIVTMEINVNQHGSTLTVRIADNGVGIAADELDKLFDRFYRGSTARKTHSPGTGLGLAICREIMERHNGGVSATSELGKGSIFTIWFPLSDLPQEEPVE